MQDTPNSTTVLFAGDTNLRDQEVSNSWFTVVGETIVVETNLVCFSKVWTWKYTVENTVVVFI